MTPQTNGSTFISLSGEAAQLAIFLTELAKSNRMKIKAQAEANGVGFARLKGGLNTPYRDIGGLIYSAQRRHLAVTVTTDPLICEAEEK